MRITVFGATGSVGREVVAEARARGHEVIAVTRKGAIAGDATNVEDVVRLSAGQDLVISATRPAPGSESELAAATKALLTGLAQTGTRLLLVGGAASLRVPATGTMLVDSPGFPPGLRDIALACNEQLAACQQESVVDWTYLSPPALLEPGERTGEYRLGTDELLFDASGDSRISTADFAVALLDEAENPRYRRRRFTVVSGK
jgi:putative NADH-flavin reductase